MVTTPMNTIDIFNARRGSASLTSAAMDIATATTLNEITSNRSERSNREGTDLFNRKFSISSWPNPLGPEHTQVVLSSNEISLPTLTPTVATAVIRNGNDQPVLKLNTNFHKLSKWVNLHRLPPKRSLIRPAEIYLAVCNNEIINSWTIRHDTLPRYFWDIFIAILVMLDVTLTPMALGFDYEPEFSILFNIIVHISFGIHFVVNMFSSFMNSRNRFCSGPSKTIPHYIFGPWAIPDLISSIPIEYMWNSKSCRLLGMIKAVRLLQFGQFARSMQSAKKASVFRLFRLIGIIIVVSHCFTCFWHYIAVEWRKYEPGWLSKGLLEKYITCWSLIIGVLNAARPSMYSPLEEFSVAMIMLLGSVLSASVFGSVALLISSFDEEEVTYNKKIIATRERCRFLGIPQALTRRIIGYYERLYGETKSINNDADAFINELSPALICEVKFQLFRDMLTQIPFLSATKIDKTVIEMLILHLRTVIYMKDDILIQKGEFGDWMGFIGSTGSVGVVDPKTDDVWRFIRILQKGDYFGEMALLNRARRTTTAVALSWVQIHVLCRNDLDDVKDQYPHEGSVLEDEIQKYMQSKAAYK